MKIAHILPVNEALTENAVDIKMRSANELINNLVTRGHEVTVFASGDSITKAQLHAFIPKSTKVLKQTSPNIEWDALQINLYHISESYKYQDQFDLIHDHTGTKGALFAENSIKPVIITLYDNLSHSDQEIYKELYKPYLVSTNNYQKEIAPHLNYIGNIDSKNVSAKDANLTDDYELIYKESIWHFNWDAKSLRMEDALIKMRINTKTSSNYITS